MTKCLLFPFCFLRLSSLTLLYDHSELRERRFACAVGLHDGGQRREQIVHLLQLLIKLHDLHVIAEDVGVTRKIEEKKKFPEEKIGSGTAPPQKKNKQTKNQSNHH